MTSSVSMSSLVAVVRKRRVGIVGFGHLGQYLYTAILNDPKASAALEVAFVWNRSVEKLRSSGVAVPEALVCEDLSSFASYSPDIVVEVCHPDVTREHGVAFASSADLFVGSPTAFAYPDLELALRACAAADNGFGVYIPGGALWGGRDIQAMADRGSLTGLCVTMKKHPSSMKLLGVLKERLDSAASTGETELFRGCVRELCPLAPNNVNTMAAAAIAAHNLGFDKTLARLVCDPALDAHVIDVEVAGLAGFSVATQRVNPAAPGAVTGNATYASFLSSLLGSGGRGNGVHMC